MKTILVGENYRQKLEKPLLRYFDDILWIPSNPKLPASIAGHADLALFQLNDVIFAASYLKETDLMHTLQNRLKGIKFVFEEVLDPYPKDAVFNVCRLGKTVFCHPKSVGKQLLNKLKDDPDLQLVDVRQGYTGCSVCRVTENSLITADPGIEKAAKSRGFDVLRIVPGFIQLPGYSTGFIGGSCISELGRKVYFSGSVRGHPNEGEILNFIEKKESKVVFLTEDPIFDFGSALILNSENSELSQSNGIL